MARLGWVAAGAWALSLACGGGSGSGSAGQTGSGGGGGGGGGDVVGQPAVVVGDFSFWGAAQGMARDVRDVSPDEGGNVWVAGSEALFVKAKGAAAFTRVDADKAGLTKNCWDPSQIANPTPPGTPQTCPIISVGGASPGRAFLGLKGVGSDGDADAPWALDSGGLDVVTFDGTAVKRERHVRVASPPGVVCEHWANPPTNTVCNENWVGSTWVSGRKKMRQIQRIAVNHDASRALSYGDAYLSATHGTLGILVAHPKERGWPDLTKGAPAWDDTKYVWEHHHPVPPSTDGRFLSGEGWAVAVDPTTSVPWYANQFRIASLPAYASISAPDWRNYWGEQVPASPHLAIWATAVPQDPSVADNVSSLSFCDDGTLWIASSTHGLARRAADGSISTVDLPAGLGNSALAVACDPSDGSVWVGFGWGGFGRLKNGAWWTYDGKGAPGFAVANPVRSIQIDRWSSPRVVWLAHTDARSGPGGVTAYRGP